MNAQDGSRKYFQLPSPAFSPFNFESFYKLGKLMLCKRQCQNRHYTGGGYKDANMFICILIFQTLQCPQNFYHGCRSTRLMNRPFNGTAETTNLIHYNFIISATNLRHCRILFLATYNWSTSGSKNHPSEYLVDLLTYLRVTFLTFTNLPVSMIQSANKLKKYVWYFICKTVPKQMVRQRETDV